MCLLLLQVNTSSLATLNTLYDHFGPKPLTYRIDLLTVPYSFVVLPLLTLPMITLYPLLLTYCNDSLSISYSITVLPLHKQKQYGADDALNMIIKELATAVGALNNDAGTILY